MEAFGIHLAEKNTKEIFLTRFANNELTGAKKSDKEKRLSFWHGLGWSESSPVLELKVESFSITKYFVVKFFKGLSLPEALEQILARFFKKSQTMCYLVNLNSLKSHFPNLCCWSRQKKATLVGKKIWYIHLLLPLTWASIQTSDPFETFTLTWGIIYILLDGWLLGFLHKSTGHIEW